MSSLPLPYLPTAKLLPADPIPTLKLSQLYKLAKGSPEMRSMVPGSRSTSMVLEVYEESVCSLKKTSIFECCYGCGEVC